jgi:hypothetical protein
VSQVLNGLNLEPASDESCFSGTVFGNGLLSLVVAWIKAVDRKYLRSLGLVLHGILQGVVVLKSQVVSKPDD